MQANLQDIDAINKHAATAGLNDAEDRHHEGGLAAPSSPSNANLFHRRVKACNDYRGSNQLALQAESESIAYCGILLARRSKRRPLA